MVPLAPLWQMLTFEEECYLGQAKVQCACFIHCMKNLYGNGLLLAGGSTFYIVKELSHTSKHFTTGGVRNLSLLKVVEGECF